MYMITMNTMMVAMKPTSEGYIPVGNPTTHSNVVRPPLSSWSNAPTNKPFVGENIDQRMFWATPAMMKRLIPLPRPQPFWTSSSSNITIIPAASNWMNIAIITVPVIVPYMPLMMYAPAWTPVSRIEKTLLADVKSPLSSWLDMSHLIIDEPTSNWRIKPAVTMGPIPSSIKVPRLEAKITLN